MIKYSGNLHGLLQPDIQRISSAFPDNVCTGRIHLRYRFYYHIEDNLSGLPSVRDLALRHWLRQGFRVHVLSDGWFQVQLWPEVEPSGSSADQPSIYKVSSSVPAASPANGVSWCGMNGPIPIMCGFSSFIKSISSARCSAVW